MIDFYGNRANETYTYRRVSWPSFEEGQDLGNVTGGSVELSAFSDLKATCSFDFEGGEEPGTDDLIRIYYSFTDDNGEYGEFCIGTFFIGYADTKYNLDGDRLMASGKVSGWSTLKVLQDVKMGYAYTVASGTNAINKAMQLIQGVGLPVNVANPSTYQLSSDYTFEPDDTLLTVVNWLCDTAGYQAPFPDSFGTVQVVPYVEPSERATVATFQDDDNSIMLPEVAVENDWQETPNVVKVLYQTDAECIAASASLVSGARASLAARGGREVTMVEEVTEISGSSQAQRITNLKNLAKKKLIDNSSEIEKVELTHAYVDGIRPLDAVAVKYADMEWTGNVTNMTVSLAVSTQCQTKLRRFVSNSLVITTAGGALW